MERTGEQGSVLEAARKRAAVEIVARHAQTLRRTARRYSLCAEDAEDAYQRALEIVLTKAPTTDLRELIRWTQTVTKHEALAVRRSREQLLGRSPTPTGGDGEPIDLVALVPAEAAGPAERAERQEDLARTREALKSLKPAELRALSLLAEGYSYAEIGEITGFSRTKINRCLAEGRERFRRFLSRSEGGERCAELRPLLSAFCDGEARSEEAIVLREHLRACGHCRSAMRAYRAAPGAAALLPAAPLWHSLLDRAREAIVSLREKLPGGGGSADSHAVQLAAGGGAKGLGVSLLTKASLACAAATATAACFATGVLPWPPGQGDGREALVIERPRGATVATEQAAAARLDPPKETARLRGPRPKPRERNRRARMSTAGTAPVTIDSTPSPEPELATAPVATAPVDPPPEPAPPPQETVPVSPPPAEAQGSESGSGGAAGEFGP